MKYSITFHRHADAVIKTDEYLNKKYNEFIDAINEITEEELIKDFYKRKNAAAKKGSSFKSITPSFNHLLKEKVLMKEGWDAEVDIFNDREGILGDATAWRLDFACKNGFAVEVAFNHGEAIAWNLIKPVLASELNHVEKAIQTQLGIYICATDAMKKAGNIDNASGSYEKVIRYLPPLMNQLTIPMVIIGLEPFETFKIDKETRDIVYLKKEE